MSNLAACPFRICSVCLVVVSLMLTSSSFASDRSQLSSAGSQSIAAHALANLPLVFEKNLGQTNTETRFLARMPNYTILLGASAATIAFQHRQPVPGSSTESNVSPRAVHLRLLGASAARAVAGENPLEAQANYFVGSDPAQWHANIPAYAGVRYSAIYKDVDLVYYGSNGNLEYDFVLRPGATPRAIRFAVEGAESARLEPSGELLISTSDSQMQLKKPVAYQTINGQRSEVPSRFQQLSASEFGLAVGAYDPRYELTIDPVLLYSTYVGGSDDEGIFGIAFDEQRNLYIAGETSSVNFPTRHPLQPEVGGNYDAFVSKFDPSGQKLIYSTYLGGSDFDHAVGVRIDREGAAYLAGITQSADFPVKNAFQPALGGTSNGFVAKLSPSGSSLVFSTYLGGSGKDQINALALGRDGNVYVTGYTNSANFPATPNVLSTQCDGGKNPACAGDAFVTRFDASGQKLVYSTYVGGNAYDSGIGIVVDEQANAYVAGQTSSPDFPVHNAYQRTLKGFSNAFVFKLNASGSQAVWSTYLGGSRFDGAFDVAIDRRHNVYVTGNTQSTDFPLAHPFQSTNRAQVDGFVTKFSAQGTSLIYSTYLGGSLINIPFRIAVSREEEAAVVGFTSSTDFPLQNPLQASYGGGNFDAFVTRFSRGGDQLQFSTYLGGTGDEFGYAITAGCDGSIWAGGSTSSTNFPLAKPFQPTYGGGPFDAFLTEIGGGHHQGDSAASPAGWSVFDDRSCDGGLN